MSIAKGSRSKLLWKVESSYGVAPTSTSYFQLPLRSESLVENINTIMSDEIRPGRSVPNIRGGNLAAGGSISTDFSAKFHIFLQHLLGGTPAETTFGNGGTAWTAYASGAKVRGEYLTNASKLYQVVIGGTASAAPTHSAGIVTTGGVTYEYVGPDTYNLYRRVITADSDFPAAGITFEKQIIGGNADRFIRFVGARLNTLGLTIPQEGIVQSDWGVVAKQPDDVNANTATVSNAETAFAMEPFTGYEAFVSFEGANAARPIREGTFNLTNNIDENAYVWGSRVRLDVPEGRREVSGSITTYFQDATEYDYFKNETEIGMKLSFMRGGLYLEFDMPDVKLTGSGTPQITGQGLMTATFNWNAFQDDGAHDIKATIYSTSAT